MSPIFDSFESYIWSEFLLLQSDWLEVDNKASTPYQNFFVHSFESTYKQAEFANKKISGKLFIFSSFSNRLQYFTQAKKNIKKFQKKVIKFIAKNSAKSAKNKNDRIRCNQNDHCDCDQCSVFSISLSPPLPPPFSLSLSLSLSLSIARSLSLSLHYTLNITQRQS